MSHSRTASPPGTRLSYLWGGVGSWRCFTNGVVGTGLWMRSWGAADLKYPGNVQTLAARTQGVCIGLTVNATTKRAQWYTDGAPTGTAIVITGGALVAASTSAFKIGKHSSNFSSSVYDTDEFKLCNRVASTAEIKAWCAAPWAGSSAYGRPWGLWHDFLNGPPKLGNSRYALTFSGPPRGRILFVLGVKDIPEFDIGKIFGIPRCLWYTHFCVQAVLPLNATGDLVLPLPIPNVTTNIGLGLTTQALGVGPTAGPILISNAVSTKIERN